MTIKINSKNTGQNFFVVKSYKRKTLNPDFKYGLILFFYHC